MIRASGLVKHYQASVAVDDISFEVASGQTLVLLGPSGCGKTTVLKLLNRLLEPDSGEVHIDGQAANSVPAHELRRKIGYVVQNFGLLPHYTVADNIAIVPRLLGWQNDRVQSRIRLLLEKVHLGYDDYAHKYPAQLSGGQQQRVGLARALAANPSVILMDEPFGALDPLTRTNIRRELLQLEELKSKTIVLVTHDVQEAFELGDQICLMQQGKLLQIGRPVDFLLQPANTFVKDFFSELGFGLKLQTIRVQDILFEIPLESPPDDNQLVAISAESSLEQILKSISQNEWFVIERANNQVLKVSRNTLLQVILTFANPS